jgi:phosphomannomutase
MQIDPTVFKAYDIRGIVGKNIDETFAEHLGRAFGSEARGGRRKGRGGGARRAPVGPGLVAALIRGLKSTGLDVVDLGAVTTPMLYYVAATRGQHGCTSGIQVTGSHNPKDYNGFKMVMSGRAIYGDDIQKLRQRIEPRPTPSGKGRSATMDIGAEYATASPATASWRGPMKIVVDSGNGIPGASRRPSCAPGLRGDRPVLQGRRRLPEPPPRPEQAREPGRPDQGRAGHRRRSGPGLRRRRRPPGRGHQGGNIIYPDRQIMLFARDVLQRNPGAPSSTTSSAASACRWPSARPAACRCCGRPATR